jgi:hypothetical protein
MPPRIRDDRSQTRIPSCAIESCLYAELSFFRERVQRRGVAILLTLLIEGLLVLLLLSLVVEPEAKRESATRLTTFSLAPAAQTAKPSKAALKPKAERPTPPETVAPPEIRIPPSPNKGFIEMSREEMAAGDISTLPKYESAAASGSSAGDSARASGQAPNGEPLYRAEWYREPTDGELAFYLPKNRPSGSWAIIACRTIADYQVENCQSLGESPPGSGIAHAMRRAAWQFRVRPPRVGNKPLIGAWVSIRFDFTKTREDNN